MTAAIRSPDSRRSLSTRKPAPDPGNSKVTSIARARRAKTGPVLPNYSAADGEQAIARTQASVLKVMPDRQSQPVWLRSLLRVQCASSAAVVLLLGGALTLYGLTAYSEQRWNQEYQKLETLRRGEQQLSAASEVLKHQLAKEAQNPETGLAPQKPADTIFLSPPPQVDRTLWGHQTQKNPLLSIERVWKRRWAIEESVPRGPFGAECPRARNLRVWHLTEVTVRDRAPTSITWFFTPVCGCNLCIFVKNQVSRLRSQVERKKEEGKRNRPLVFGAIKNFLTVIQF